MDRTINVTLSVDPHTNELTDVKLEVTQWQVVDWRASLHVTDTLDAVDLVQDVIGMLPDNAIGDSTRETLRMLSVEVSSIEPPELSDADACELVTVEDVRAVMDELPEPVYETE